jgi:lantibiotic leader peptide-processing serine protease
MRTAFLFALLGVLALLVPITSGAADSDSQQGTFVVLYERGASAQNAAEAVRGAGGQIVEVNEQVGVATVESSNANFVTDVAQSDAVAGAARNRPVGHAPTTQPADPFALERMTNARQRMSGRGRVRGRGARTPENEPFADLQWDMRMINATPAGSYRREQGRGVRVGIIDTGVDGSHADIAPNFNRALSRNFTTDIPSVDGPCEEEPDASCSDPANVDENSHGTHVAGTIGSPINQLGIAGVAPRVELVNLRAGQDSGYFFLQASVDALTYAGDNGIDVVNMSYYIDPWLFNCTDNPADSPEEQLEQATIIQATQRALAYARSHGVTLVSAAGNGNTDYDNPTFDDSSPDFPPGSERERNVDNECLSMPSEGRNVLAITSLGPSERKAYYSDYGVEHADLSAPGGDRRDRFGTSQYLSPTNTVLAPYPKNVAEEAGELNPDGTPNTPFVLADCARGPCQYYQYAQGTSMASPHAVGVAALAVAAHGTRDREQGGLMMSPAAVERVLRRTARDHACPNPRTFRYPDPDLGPEYTAVCRGPKERNSFYGDGIVDALAAVR